MGIAHTGQGCTRLRDLGAMRALSKRQAGALWILKDKTNSHRTDRIRYNPLQLLDLR